MATIPFSDTAQATSDASGNIVFARFQVPRMLEWRQGSFSVVGADGSVVVPGTVLPVTWKAYVGPTIWGTFYNDQPSNMVQTNGPPVSVKGINLAASTAYQCIFTGYDSDGPPALSPLPAPAPPPSGFTQLVNAAGVAPGSGTVSLLPSGNPTPVAVGTSLEIALFEGNNGSARLIITWSQTAGGIRTNQFIYDVPSDALTDHFGFGFSLSGLVLPNLGPFVEIYAASANHSTGTVDAFINTGLPPVTKEPIVMGGILFSENPPAGTSTINLPPYTGPAFITMQPNNEAGFGITVNSYDYLGNLQAQSRPEQGWPAGTGPFSAGRIVFLPPLVNILSITGATGSGETVSGITLGP